jgi:hypothetical protein
MPFGGFKQSGAGLPEKSRAGWSFRRSVPFT